MEKKRYYILTNNINDYLDQEFIGYSWKSDERVPELINGKFNLPEIGTNPYVAEANLYAKDGSVSISIEHIDGQYLIGIVDWKEVESDKSVVLEEQTYLTHRLTKLPGAEDFGKLKFVRAWIPVNDPLCEKMEVLEPAWHAFKGFVKVINLNPEIEKS